MIEWTWSWPQFVMLGVCLMVLIGALWQFLDEGCASCALALVFLSVLIAVSLQAGGFW